MHLKAEPSLPLIEQFQQVAALIEAFVVKTARARKMPVLDIRTLLCIARLAARGADWSRPGEICEHTGYPKNRVSEALGRLCEQGLVRDCGAATSDGRTRAFRITDRGRRLASAIVHDLQVVEDLLRCAMNTQSSDGRSAHLSRTVKTLRAIPTGTLRV